MHVGIATPKSPGPHEVIQGMHHHPQAKSNSLGPSSISLLTVTANQPLTKSTIHPWPWIHTALWLLRSSAWFCDSLLHLFPPWFHQVAWDIPDLGKCVFYDLPLIAWCSAPTQNGLSSFWPLPPSLFLTHISLLSVVGYFGNPQMALWE